MAWQLIALLRGACLLVIADGGDPVATVQGLVQRADFEAAEARATALLAGGNLDRGTAAALHFQLGILASARGRSEAASDSFMAAIRLDPGLRLPPSAGPHVQQAFSRAQRRLSERPPREPFVVLKDKSVGRQPAVEVSVVAEPDDLARRVRLVAPGFRQELEIDAPELRLVVSLPVTISGCTSLSTSVLDRHGNNLWPELSKLEVCTREPLAAPVPQPRRDVTRIASAIATSPRPPPAAPGSPTPRGVWLGLALTSGLAVATGGLGIAALDRRASYLESRTEDRRDTALRTEHFATAAGLATALVGVTTLVLYLSRPPPSAAAGTVGRLPRSLALWDRF